MAKQIINIGAAPNDRTGDPLRTAFDKINDNFNELYPITTDVVYTVAADGTDPTLFDFATMDEALIWLTKQIIKGGSVKIRLEAGFHIVPDSYNTVAGAHVITGNVTIDGIIEYGGTVTITTELNSTATSLYYWEFVDGAFIRLEGITIDLEANGSTTVTSSALGCSVSRNSYMSAYNMVFKNMFAGGIASSNSVIKIVNSSILECSYGIISYGCRVLIDGTVTIDGGGTGLYGSDGAVYTSGDVLNLKYLTSNGIYFRDGSKFSAKVGGTLSFVGNTVDTNITINEIQYDSGYIVDGSGPLSFKP